MEAELTAILAPHFPDIAVAVQYRRPWDRMCVCFRWEGFEGMLPEERFHKLLQVIPEDFRTSRLRGHVWLELTPEETTEAFLSQRRSEDVAGIEAGIYARLAKAGFFGKLREALGPSPDETCTGDFSKTTKLLFTCKHSADRIDEAKLLFIRHGAYCDCQIPLSVEHELAKAYGHE